MSYAITAGDGGGVFAIGTDGAITVADGNQLDYETVQQYVLTVTVTDDGTPNMNDTATITIDVTDGNEAPTAVDATFSVAENSANGTAVGTVQATDPDSGDILSYAITGGDGGGVFAIGTDRAIAVADGNQLDYETVQQIVLTVTVTDDGTPNMNDTATITIDVTDGNEAPTAVDATFLVAEQRQRYGRWYGQATDPDSGDSGLRDHRRRWWRCVRYRHGRCDHGGRRQPAGLRNGSAVRVELTVTDDGTPISTDAATTRSMSPTATKLRPAS